MYGVSPFVIEFGCVVDFRDTYLSSNDCKASEHPFKSILFSSSFINSFVLDFDSMLRKY